MFHARKLVLAHFWVAFAAFTAAIVLGEWQMFVRSPLSPWVNNPEHYYRSVTAHGTVMAYVLPTLVAMGFGYAITELALRQPLVGRRWAWAGLGLVLGGTLLAAVAMALGKASVLYTFYPPMVGSPLYYLGVVLVVVGSWIWVALMSLNLHRWKKAHPGERVPLAMYGNVAGAYLWAWTSVGLLGMPRRMAYYDYTHPAIQPQAWTVVASTLGGLVLVVSALLFVGILLRAHRQPRMQPPPFQFSVEAHPGGRTPALLNGYGLWLAMMVGLTLVNYGFPIAQLAVLPHAQVPVIPIGSR